MHIPAQNRVEMGRDRSLILVAAAVHTLLLCAVLVQPLSTKPEGLRAAFRRLYVDAMRSPGPAADLFAVYHAGVNVRRGLSPFHPAEEPQATPYYYPFRYLPVVAHGLGRILASLPPHVAFLAWCGVVETFLILFVLAVRSSLPVSAKRSGLTVLLLVSAPYWLELYMGQFTAASGLLAALSVLAWTHRAKAVSGRTSASILMLMSAALKVYPLVTLVGFLRDRRGLRFVEIVVVALVMLNLPLFWGDSLAWDAFWAKNFIGDASGLDAGNHGILYALFVLTRSWWETIWPLTAWGWFTIAWRMVVLVATAVLVYHRPRAALETAVATMLLSHFVSYFQVWEHHMSGVLIAGSLLAIGRHVDGVRAASAMFWVALTFLALPTPYVLLPPNPGGWPYTAQLLMPLTKAIPLAMLYVIALKSMAAEPSAKSAPSRTV